MSEQPSPRYQRSFPALVGAMIVTLLFVMAFVVWRSIFRADVEVEPEPVDWESSVELAEEAGLTVAHPRSLPEGWIATSVDLRAGDRPRWGLGVLTDEERFVGIRQEDTSLVELLDTYVDEDAVQGETVTIDSEVADEWETWSDDGGDHAFATEVGDETLLVYGSAPEDVIEQYVADLVLSTPR